MLKRAIALTALTLSLSGVAFAGPTEDAEAHFKAIASGNVDMVMKAYGDHPVLEWVGGPLDGTYTGEAKVRETWTKFTAAQGSLTFRASKIDESSNAKGATVTANVEFKGKAPIKVRYVLLYRDGKLVNEIWQIDPKLAASY
jgi:hypothetical protein